MIDSKVSNVYPDEQDRLDELEKEQELVMSEIQDVLDKHGWGLVAVLEDGLPYVDLIKL